MTRPPPSHSVLLHDARRAQWLLFRNPVRIFETTRLDSVKDLLRAVEKEVEENGMQAAGFVSYEAGPAFDPALHTRPPSAIPLAWFGIYREPETVDLPVPPPDAAASIPWTPDVSEGDYHAALLRIKEAIRAGETYQVNYTYRLRAPFAGDPWPLFLRMIAAQGPGYGAYLNLDRTVICSSSPELFFSLHGNRLESKPMKGTAPRGLWTDEDRRLARELVEQEKTRAENVMIVDMVRNDMGRVAETGAVQVPRLFEAEKYPTLWQMTSTVQAVTRAGLAELFGALFPPASITGAPKVSTMRIIAELEQSPRGVYTGAIGWLAPGRAAQFNVAIRTVVVDQTARTAEYGVGGGIVWDSHPSDEWQECRTKAKVLDTPMPAFALLETLLWEPGTGYAYLREHLERLHSAADYFLRAADPDALRACLDEAAAAFPPKPHRVRLLIPAQGAPRAEASLLAPLPHPFRVRLAKEPVSSLDRFLYHKTTNRTAYDRALAGCPGYPDVLLWNERGELTESCMANVIVERGGCLLTPPVQSGLLAGIGRARLLREGQIKEAVIPVKELHARSRLFLVNSVRGPWEARLEP